MIVVPKSDYSAIFTAHKVQHTYEPLVKTVLPYISDNALPTLKFRISNTEITYVLVANLYTKILSQIIVVPIRDTAFKILALVGTSRLTLGTFETCNTTIHATITSTPQRLCLFSFGNWSWPLMRDVTPVINNAWYCTKVLYVPISTTGVLVTNDINHVPDFEFVAPSVGGVATIVVNSYEDGIDEPRCTKIIMQELPGGASKWFYSVGGCVVWCGIGRARTGGETYRLHIENGSIFAGDTHSRVCVSPLGKSVGSVNTTFQLYIN